MQCDSHNTARNPKQVPDVLSRNGLEPEATETHTYIHTYIHTFICHSCKVFGLLFGLGVLGVGRSCGLLVCACWLLVFACWLLVLACWLLAFSAVCLLAVGIFLLAVVDFLLAVAFVVLVVGCVISHVVVLELPSLPGPWHDAGNNCLHEVPSIGFAWAHPRNTT